MLVMAMATIVPLGLFWIYPEVNDSSFSVRDTISMMIQRLKESYLEPKTHSDNDKAIDINNENWVRILELIRNLSRENNVFNVELITGIRDYKQAVRDVRAYYNFTWEQVSDSIKKGGRDNGFCTLLRDNWGCQGEVYEEFLKQIPPYDHDFDLGAFPSNSQLFFQGNSMMGQIGQTIICNTQDVVVWSLQAAGGGGQDPKDAIMGNSFLAYHPKKNITMMLLSNHPSDQSPWAIQHHIISPLLPNATTAVLKKVGFIPDYIVTTSLNNWMQMRYPVARKRCIESSKMALENRNELLDAFPNAKLYWEIFHWELLNEKSCCADGRNCAEKFPDDEAYQKLHYPDCEAEPSDPRCVCHSCSPGPVDTKAEQVIRNMIQVTTPPLNDESSNGESTKVRLLDDVVFLWDGMKCNITDGTFTEGATTKTGSRSIWGDFPTI